MRLFSEAQEFRLSVPHSLDWCQEQLKPHVGSEWSLFGGGSPLKGFLKENRLFLRKKISYSNSFQRVLDAEVVSEATRTTFTGTIQVDRKIMAFTRLWMVGWVLLSLVFIISEPSLKNIIFGAGGILFAYGLVKVGEYSSRDEPDFLEAYLKEVFK